MKQGRMKYVHPILRYNFYRHFFVISSTILCLDAATYYVSSIRDLFMWPETREKAYDVFQQNKSKMMHVLVVKLEAAYRSTSTEKK